MNDSEFSKVHALLKKFSTAMLITHAGQGSLRARPMAIAALEDDGRLWFFTSRESAKAHEIARDTRVLLVLQNERDTYLSLAGGASLSEDPQKIRELWKESFKVWFPGGVDDPEIALISVQPHEAEYWDTRGWNKVKYLFETARAYVTGTTPKIEEGQQHGVLTL